MAVRDLLKGASPGPWKTYRDGAEAYIQFGDGTQVRIRPSTGIIRDEDLALIAMAREGVEVLAKLEEDEADAAADDPTDPGEEPEHLGGKTETNE